jgi:hypothetical protein
MPRAEIQDQGENARLTFDSARVVVIGRFNPYILSPQWLLQHEVWEKEQVHLALGAVGEGIQFKSLDGETTWEADGRRLAVSSKSDAGQLVQRVLRLLPHTPIQACSINFAYSADHWGSGLVPKLGPLARTDIAFPVVPGITKWTAVFHLERIRIDMSIACGEQGITLSFQFHRSIGSADEAIELTERFEEFKRLSIEMIKNILGEDVK